MQTAAVVCAAAACFALCVVTSSVICSPAFVTIIVARVDCGRICRRRGGLFGRVQGGGLGRDLGGVGCGVGGWERGRGGSGSLCRVLSRSFCDWVAQMADVVTQAVCGTVPTCLATALVIVTFGLVANATMSNSSIVALVRKVIARVRCRRRRGEGGRMFGWFGSWGFGGNGGGFICRIFGGVRGGRRGALTRVGVVGESCVLLFMQAAAVVGIARNSCAFCMIVSSVICPPAFVTVVVTSVVRGGSRGSCGGVFGGRGCRRFSALASVRVVR